MGIWYATREQIQNSLDIRETARAKTIIDAKLEAASRSLEGLLHRRFYPERRTISLDWPNFDLTYAWQIWLGDNELITLETLVSGGVTIPGANVLLRRGDDRAEPPYNLLEISLASSSALSGGTTFQRSNVITGIFGYNDTDTSLAGCAFNANINSSVS